MLVFACFIYAFWFFVHPESLSYHEQYQLFLFSCDYLVSRLSVAGGVCDYLSEFIVQFYYCPAFGALLLTAVFVLLQMSLWKAARLLGASESSFVFSFLPSLLILAYMGDENVLLSFPLALVVVLLTFCASFYCYKWIHFFIIPLLYWIAGPVVVVYVILLASHFILEKNYAYCIGIVPYALASIYLLSHIFLVQYPWPDVWGGINYHRNRLTYPILQFVIEAVVAILPIAMHFVYNITNKWVCLCEYFTVFISGVLFVCFNYDKDKYYQIKCDYLVRYEQWNDIIENAEHYQSATLMSANSVNLALAKTGQLGERMFEFYQCGPKGLFSEFDRNMVACLPIAEAFYHLGMVNSAMRYYFDLQESILNGRKSGRMTKRLAELNIVNGRYDVAQKYINDLKMSLFYSQWARDAERCLLSEDSVNNDVCFGRLRRLRYKSDFLYSSAEMSKMLALLWNQNKDNTMAFDYMMANIMLECDMQSFVSAVPWLEVVHGDAMPRHYQEVFAMFWLQNIHVDGYELSEQMKREVKKFDAFFLLSNDIDKLRRSKWSKSYWTYCMLHRFSTSVYNGSNY